MKFNEWVDFYRDQGFNIIPLLPQSKKPAIEWKEYQTEKYEGDFKEGQGIAIITGEQSKLIVIDLDSKELLQEVFTKWKDLFYHTLVIETNRGYHIYTRPRNGVYPRTAKLIDNRGRKIDIKGEGGYVVAPPSIHPDGGNYKVVSYSKDIEEIDLDALILKLQKEYHFSGGLKTSKLSEIVDGAIMEGSRNDAAYVMSRFLLNPTEGGHDEKDAWVELIKWNENNLPPLDKDELERTFDSAKNVPFEERPEEFDLKSFKRNYVARHITLTLHPKTLRENKEIYVYKDGLYIDGGDTHIEEMLHKLYYGIPRNEVSELLATIRATTYVTNDDFDRYPELIHVKNCIINVKNMKTTDQTPDLLTRNQIQTVYNPATRCPKINQFLSEIMPDSADQKTLVELLASVLLHKVKLEKAIIFVGDQANGKSTLIELMISILGEQNVSNVSLQRLSTNQFSSSTMMGKILNAYGDLDIVSIEQTGMIKQIISHEHIMVEKKNKNAFSTKILIRLLYSANRLPDFPNADDAIFRRFWIIKFPITIPPEKRDVELLSKLTTPEEKSGFLNMLLKNAQVLIKRNFKFTHYQSLEKTKSLWREKSDSVSAFVESEVVINPNSIIKSVEFYEYYRRWCQENDEKLTTIKMFYAKLVSLGPFSKGYSSENRKSIRVIRGCTTKSIISEQNKIRGQTQFNSP